MAQRNKKWLTEQQALESLNCSGSSLYRLRKRGLIHAVKLFPGGRDNRYDHHEIEAYKRARAREAAQRA